MPWNNITPKCELLFPQQNQLESGILEAPGRFNKGTWTYEKDDVPPGSCKTY
jgi:hypothetical protein